MLLGFPLIGQQRIANDDFYIYQPQRGLLGRAPSENDVNYSGLICQLMSQTASYGNLTLSGGPGNPLCGIGYQDTPPTTDLGLEIGTYQNVCGSGCTDVSNTASIYVFKLPDDAHNAGSCPLPPHPSPNVGNPVNVTNGNMWLEQTDYSLPGIGEPIVINRFYNSIIQRNGLFGLGWTTQYDESLQFYDGRMARVNMPDGRAIYLGRTGTSGAYTLSPSVFYGQLVPNGDGTHTLFFKDGRAHKFDSKGKLVWQKDRNGNQTTLNYNKNGVLTGVTDAAGRTLTISMNANGNVSQILDSMGNVATYEYETVNNVPTNQLKRATYNDGSQSKFEYTTRTVDGQTKILLTTVKDALDNILEHHEYDTSARATTSEKQSGTEKYTLDYSFGDFTTVTDVLGRETKYYFEFGTGRNLITKVEGLCGCGGSGTETTSYQYDGRLNLTKKTDALGRQTTYTYDNNGNAVSMTDFLGTQTFTYNSFGEVLKYRDRVDSQNQDPNVTTMTNTYDTNGNLVTTKDALGNVTTLAYPATNNNGLPDSIKDARNNITKFKWFTKSGLLEEVEDPYGKKTNFTYDARGRTDTITNALGHVTDYNYFDDTQRKVEMIYPNLDKITYKFDIRRLPESATDERGKITTYEFDPQYRLKKITDPLGHVKEFGYDDMSNMKLYKDPLGNITDYRYDDFDRLKEVEYPAATVGATRLKEKREYDKLGRIKKFTDTANRDTLYVYDDQTLKITITNAELEATELLYNQRLQTTEVKDAINQVYTFAYDPLGRILSETRAGQSMSFSYDAVGNRKTRTDGLGRLTSYTYDNLNRLTMIEYGATALQQSPVTFGYDDISRLTSAVNEVGTVTFAYDNRNRMTSTTDVFGHIIKYEFEKTPTVNQRRIKLDGSLYAIYNYDDADRLQNIVNAADNTMIGYTYFDDDAVQTRTYPNGVSTLYAYDNMRRLTRLTDTGPAGTLFDRQYAYNTANQIEQIIEPALTRIFAYDSIDRLRTVSNGGSGESYIYDHVGNRTSSHFSSAYGYQTGFFNRLTSSQTATYNYDANGNIVSKSEGSNFWRYAFDNENRMYSASTRRQAVKYSYDALGRRVSRNLGFGQESSKFTYDGQDVLLDDNAGTHTRYLNGEGIDNKLRQTTGSATSYFLGDHLGSTNGLANSTGNLTALNTYDSFGRSSNPTFPSRYQFTGREYDAFTGLQFSRARWYDSNLGRFVSEDPIGLEGGINQYGYVSNNPLNATDPFGMYEIDVHYYLTYYLAMKTGCFSQGQASAIANANQMTDENAGTAPGFNRRYANSHYHALNPDARPGLGSSSIGSPYVDFKEFGQRLHYYQDSFSHAGFHNSVIGHSMAGHLFDKTNTDIQTSIQMTVGTASMLEAFGRRLGCKCRSQWTNHDVTAISGFLQAPGSATPALNSIDSTGGWLDFGITNSPDYLENKRRWLGFPPAY